MFFEISSNTNNGHASSHHNNDVSSNPNKSYQKDILNSYFLHPNENSVLVTHLLMLKIVIINLDP